MAADELSLLIQDVVNNDLSRLPMLARKTGKSQQALLREVDPNNTRAKLGVETLLKLLGASKDIRPLQYIAHCMGMELVPREGRNTVRDGRRGGL